MTIPAYVYTLVTILMDIVAVEYGTLHYIFNACGMIINTIVILFFIYINKYYEVFINESKGFSKRFTSIINTSDNTNNSSTIGNNNVRFSSSSYNGNINSSNNITCTNSKN